MTCLAALIHDWRVYMGGDSSASVDNSIEVRTNRKVFRNGAYVIGFTGSFRVGQLLQYDIKMPPPVGDIMGHLVGAFIPQLQKAAGKETDEIMLGTAGRLFKVSSDYSVAEYPSYAAAGGGEQYALGKLHGSLGPPDVRIIAALEAAEAHCPAVRAPFHIEVA